MSDLLKEYQEFTKSTNICNHYENGCDFHDIALHHILFGLLAEAGEVAGKYQKSYRSIGRSNTISDIDEEWLLRGVSLELGDLLWHISELCNYYDIQLSDVIKQNMEKLKSRKERGVIEGSGDTR